MYFGLIHIFCNLPNIILLIPWQTYIDPDAFFYSKQTGRFPLQYNIKIFSLSSQVTKKKVNKDFAFSNISKNLPNRGSKFKILETKVFLGSNFLI